MEFITLFFDALIDLSNAMAPYILFGLFFAGILHELVPETLISRHLGKNSIGSVIKATLFGVPLPVCSCGVIPLATSINKSGASKGATLSFLISTPITGVDSILATYGMFGWAFTMYRVMSSIIISMLAGILSNVVVKKEKVSTSFSVQAVDPVKNTECSGSCTCANEEKRDFSFTGAMRYAFVTLLSDIATPLFLGLLIGAFITVATPSNLSEILINHTWFSYLIVIVIAVPMYVCATASLPMAAGLMLAGVSPGAAFVFLSAGPATNTVTIGVVKKMLGTQTLYIYLGTIVLGSILFGLGLDYLMQDISIKEMINMNEKATVIEWLSSIFLWGFVFFFMVQPYLQTNKQTCCSSIDNS